MRELFNEIGDGLSFSERAEKEKEKLKSDLKCAEDFTVGDIIEHNVPYHFATAVRDIFLRHNPQYRSSVVKTLEEVKESEMHKYEEIELSHCNLYVRKYEK